MLRVIIGAAAAAVAMFVIGFIFFGLGLQTLAIKTVGDLQAAPIQQALRANIADTGTYAVPGDRTPEQTRMYGTGPVATIHYNVNGQVAGMNAGTLLKGLVFNFAIALAIGLALIGIDGRVQDFRSRARVAAIIGVAAAAFTHLGVPLYYPHGLGYYFYLFLADGIALAVGGVIVAWFLKAPKEPAAVGEVSGERPAGEVSPSDPGGGRDP
ncbi:MAG TPA: hypothetical protein VMG08_10345 [Allosphingosinicella sp.]|nr:hypothetical protein [Allosphingosinicella sp.]